MRVSALGAVLAAVTAILLGGCGSSPDQDGATSTNPTTGDAPSSVPNTPPLAVIPANNHVTGTYPASCVRPQDADPKLPVVSCTPGSIRSDVTQTSLTTTICHKGWAASVRPPEAETNKIKTVAMSAYGVPATLRNTARLDHLIPLELGGSNDESNLWIQDQNSSDSKDRVENDLHAAVCAGTVTLADAQQAIASNWETAEQHLVLPSNNR